MGGSGGVRVWGVGQGGCERRIKAFVKILKKKFFFLGGGVGGGGGGGQVGGGGGSGWWGGWVRVDVNAMLG